MRTKVLAAAGISVVLLSGCSQGAPDPAPGPVQPVTVVSEDALLPAYPANETHLGSVLGSGSSSAGFGPAGSAKIAVYLACSTDGEVTVIVSNKGKTTVPCGTKDKPTRTVFHNPSTAVPLSVDVESGDKPVVWGLVLTDANS